MLSTNIEAEYDHHIVKLRNPVFEDFSNRAADDVAARSSEGFLPRKMESPIDRAEVFYELIENEYNSKLRNAIENTKSLFAKHGLLFRLYDIEECLHGFHRLTLLWSVPSSKVYVFDFLFDSSRENPFESFYRLTELDSAGTPINGDVVNETIKLFEDESPLPEWFVNGLRAYA